MTLIQKIKSYFIHYKFSKWHDFHWDQYALHFRALDNDVLLDLAQYVQNNLEPSTAVGSIRHRLLPNESQTFENLDQLLQMAYEIVQADFEETFIQSKRYNWEFRYFVGAHESCPNTICLSNGIKAKTKHEGNCTYALITVQKMGGTYYCWNHLNRPVAYLK